MPESYDVIVVGGGNAGLCAALEARRGGATVLILEAAPKHLRGGNSRHVRNLRHLHAGPINYLVGSYEEEEFYQDLLQVTGGATNEALARMTIRSSVDLGTWVLTNGVRWQGPLKGTLQLSRTNSFFLGGGKAVVNAYYQTAEDMGIQAWYEAEVTDIVPDSGAPVHVDVQCNGSAQRLDAKAIVVAAGGFEANREWMARQWGDAARNFAVRGTPYNRGRATQALFDRGAKAIGDTREFHSVAVDARGPMFDGGIVTRLDTVPFGIVVNRHGKRFADEGQDYWPKRYATWGGLIARQDGQVAYSLVDAKMINDFMPSLYRPYKANTLYELAVQLGLNPEAICETVAVFNAGVEPGTFDVATLDDCHTAGIDPPKSHWARRLDTPPFYAYPLRPGITFTYHGLQVDERAQVIAENDMPIPGVFAAGESMAGNILGRGYLAGFGMTIGSVFGRIAGREAAARAKH